MCLCLWLFSVIYVNQRLDKTNFALYYLHGNIKTIKLQVVSVCDNQAWQNKRGHTGQQNKVINTIYNSNIITRGTVGLQIQLARSRQDIGCQVKTKVSCLGIILVGEMQAAAIGLDQQFSSCGFQIVIIQDHLETCQKHKFLVSPTPIPDLLKQKLCKCDPATCV